MAARIVRDCRLLLAMCVLSAGAAAAEMPHGYGLLWRVTAPGGEISHLFGTMHSAEPAIVTLAPPVQAAFDSAQRVVLELDMESQTLVASAALLMFDDGQTLSDKLPPALYRRVVELGRDKGLPEVVLQRLRPWAAGVTLAAPAQKQGEFLDLKLAAMARAAGKPVIGLEQPAEQLATFTALSDADQLQLLRGILDEFDQLDGMYASIEQAYLARDLVRLLELGRQDLQQDDPRLARILLAGLIDNRNARMALRLRVLLGAGGNFVAVGALHLPGERGLIALLIDQGYRVERVW